MFWKFSVIQTVVKKELLVLDRSVCFWARPCHGKNTQKHKKLAGSPHGMTVVKRLQGIWLAGWKKTFPTGLTIKRTVCCKSPRPYAIIESRMELWNWLIKRSVLLNMEYCGIHCYLIEIQAILSGENIREGSLMGGTIHTPTYKHSCPFPNNLSTLKWPPEKPWKLVKNKTKTKPLRNSLLTPKTVSKQLSKQI